MEYELFLQKQSIRRKIGACWFARLIYSQIYPQRHILDLTKAS